MKCLFILLSLALAPLSMAASSQGIEAVGNLKAPKGGSLTLNISGEPTTLHPITSTDGYARDVQTYVVEGLMNRNPNTNEWEPGLAESVNISKDKKTYEFTLRQGLKWSDGKPITAEDVKFSFDVYFDEKYKALHVRPYLEGIERAEVVNERTVRFTAKDTYFGNFSSIAGGIVVVLPKHVYSDPEKSKELNKTVIGSGPYMMDKYEKGKRIVLKKNKNWWGNNIPELKGMYNFETIILKFIKEDNVALEMLKKGEIDFMGLTPEQYMQKTSDKPWGEKVFKVKTQNDAPVGYGFIAWNLTNDLFKEKSVRRALAHLMNRDLMNKKFLFDTSLMATGPWYQQSMYASKNVKAIPFDVKAAIELFKKSGWTDTDGDLILDKVVNGKKLKMSFTLLNPSEDMNKYFTIFKEDAKKAGVEVNIKNLEWNSFVKLLDERKFEAMTLSWTGGDIDLDPKQIWHSSSAAVGGSNFNGYSNPQVDKLIDEARLILDAKKRATILQKVYELIAEDAPYLFLFNRKYSLYGHTKQIKRDKDTYRFRLGQEYWWMEP